MARADLPIWKEVPFIRIIIPLVAGIMMARFLPLPEVWQQWTYAIFLLSALFTFLYSFLPLGWQYALKHVAGVAIMIPLFLLGYILFYESRPEHDPRWIGNNKSQNHPLIVSIEAPLQEKAKSYKATATSMALLRNDSLIKISGDIFIYFRKDSVPVTVKYGDVLIINKDLQRITSSGNPGSFDYAAYCALKGIYYQVFLTEKDYSILPGSSANMLNSAMYKMRESIISVLRKYIPGKEEQGLAEALLIGYKDDLDKDLLMAYSNSGVVHVIAISGLHLGLIYLLLTRLCKSLPMKNKILQGTIVVAGLWIFSALAGGSPSVLRSATMFSFIVVGDWMQRKPSGINSLLASAFILLCFEPAWLWDTGFQLSYAAVFGLMILSRPIYNMVYLKNPMLDNLWKMNSVTISAQLLTLPLTIYYFHQFPNLFMLTNLIVIPLSGFALMAEILLCVVSFIEPLGEITGFISELLIKWMNAVVYYVDKIPLASWKHLNFTLFQAFACYLLISLICLYLLRKEKKYLFLSLFTIVIFLSERMLSFKRASLQQIVVVYNISGHQAIDIISGRETTLIGDRELAYDEGLRMYNINSARILFRTTESSFIESPPENSGRFKIGGKQIQIINSPIIEIPENPTNTDLIIISKNPRLVIDSLIKYFPARQIVADGSNSGFNAMKWAETCRKLEIPFHDVATKGAFVMKMN